MIIFNGLLAFSLIFCVYYSAKYSDEILATFLEDNYFYDEFNSDLNRATAILKRWLLISFIAILVSCYFHYYKDSTGEIIFKIISFLSVFMVYFNYKVIKNIRNEINIIKNHLTFTNNEEENCESFSYSGNSGEAIIVYLNEEYEEDEMRPIFLTIDNYYLKTPFIFYIN